MISVLTLLSVIFSPLCLRPNFTGDIAIGVMKNWFEFEAAYLNLSPCLFGDGVKLGLQIYAFFLGVP